ncbi:MAG: hypothetical protein ACQKBU_00900 [Verrucomicrobiales bacterium]
MEEIVEVGEIASNGVAVTGVGGGVTDVLMVGNEVVSVRLEVAMEEDFKEMVGVRVSCRSRRRDSRLRFTLRWKQYIYW